MTIESQVYEALKVLAGSQVYPDVAPEGTLPPYITYQAVGGQPINYLTGEKPGRRNARMQVSVWAATRLGAASLAQQVEDALRDAKALQTEVLTGQIATYDEDTKYRGVIQDYSVWS
jgi:hypothetical protein